MRLYLTGFCMGVADLIPGISGGTVAFVLGVYPKLILAVRNPLSHHRFLLSLGSGMVTAILLLAGVIHRFLQQPETRIPLYGLFCGLILGSVALCFKKVHRWTAQRAMTLLFATMATYAVTVGLQVYDGEISGWWIALSGFFAIAAMLLPGISGSYVIMVFGVYPPLIKAIAHIANLDFQWESLRILVFLGAGILAGALCFIRGIDWLLRRHPQNTFATLLGCMVGALPAVWPFVGEENVLLLPEWNLSTAIAFTLMVAGIGCSALGVSKEREERITL